MYVFESVRDDDADFGWDDEIMGLECVVPCVHIRADLPGTFARYIPPGSGTDLPAVGNDLPGLGQAVSNWVTYYTEKRREKGFGFTDYTVFLHQWGSPDADDYFNDVGITSALLKNYRDKVPALADTPIDNPPSCQTLFRNIALNGDGGSFDGMYDMTVAAWQSVQTALDADGNPYPALNLDDCEVVLSPYGALPFGDPGAWLEENLADARSSTEEMFGGDTLDDLWTDKVRGDGSALSVNTAQASFHSDNYNFFKWLVKTINLWKYESHAACFEAAFKSVFPGGKYANYEHFSCKRSPKLPVPDGKPWLTTEYDWDCPHDYDDHQVYVQPPQSYQGTAEAMANWHAALGTTSTGDTVKDIQLTSEVVAKRKVSMMREAAGAQKKIIIWIPTLQSGYTGTASPINGTDYTYEADNIRRIWKHCIDEGIVDFWLFWGNPLPSDAKKALTNAVYEVIQYHKNTRYSSMAAFGF